MGNLDPRLQNVGRVAAPLAVVVAIVVLLLPITRAVDLNVFLRAGSAVLHGRDLYPPIDSPAVYSGYSFVYPALAALPFVPLAALPADLATAIFFVVSACAVAAAASAASRRDPWIPALVLGTSFTITGLQLGALSPLMFAGAICLWKLRAHPIPFALVAAPVIVSKLFLAPLLVWPLLAKRYRAVAWAASLSCLLLGVGFLAGPLGLPGYLHLLSQLASHEAGAGFGLISVLRNAGLGPSAAQAAAVVLGAAVVAGAYLHHRRARDERVLFAAGIVCALLLTPVLWSHYLVLVPAALLVLGARRRWFVALAVTSWVIAPPHGLHWHLLPLTVPGPVLAVALLLVLGLARRAAPVR